MANIDDFSGRSFSFFEVLTFFPLPSLVTDNELTIIHVNPAFTRLTGFSLEEVQGTVAPYPWWPPARHREYLADLQMVKEGRPPRTDWLFAGRNGQPFWIKAVVAPLIVTGQTVGRLACWTDITTQKLAEAALRDELSVLKERGPGFRLA